MLWYIVKLVVLLPLIGGMIWGSVRLSRAMQQKLGAPQGGRSVRVVETMMLSPTIKLAVLEFHGKEILVSASRTGLARLAEAPARGGDGTPQRADAGDNSDDADSWLARSHVTCPSDGPDSPQSAKRGGKRPETFTQTLRRFK